MQASKIVLMIKPKYFGFNVETAATNSFQNNKVEIKNIGKIVEQEFNNAVNILQQQEIEVLVYEDQDNIVCPDAVFCNNWFSTHAGGLVFIYPMQSVNRQLEIRQDIIDDLGKKFVLKQVKDLRTTTTKNEFLESTGSIVFDHNNSLAFACLSQRTNENLVRNICKQISYKPILYTCVNDNNLHIYHTNVILCITSKLIVAYVDGIINEIEKQSLLQHFQITKKEIIIINYKQVQAFCGNMLSVLNTHNNEILLLSTTAFNAFTPTQITILKKHHQLVVIPIPTIETIGGGGIRCMLAQIFLKKISS